MLLVAVVVLRPGVLADSIVPFVSAYAYAVAAAGLFLGWLFRRSRIIFAILVLAVADRALLHFTGDVGVVVFNAVALLLPLNLVGLAMVIDRGILTVRSLLVLLPILLQVLVVGWVCQSDELELLAWLGFSIVDARFTSWTSIPQLALVAFAVAVVIQAVRFLRDSKVIEAGFFWALGAVFFALTDGPEGGWLSTSYLATAGLILVVALLESSYRMAYYDELTGLPGRRALNEALRRLGKRYTVGLVDIDHFKKFNDTHGHDVGDQVLRMVASKLRNVSGGGKAYRYGGEEFAVFFRGKSLGEAHLCLEELREMVEMTPFVLRGRKRPRTKPVEPIPEDKPRKRVSVTVSIGVAERGDRKLEPKEVIKAADEALYRAKDAGRNRVQC
ncbi:MAG: GGDEF domain-containing protein [Planctomycetota bacterium]